MTRQLIRGHGTGSARITVNGVTYYKLHETSCRKHALNCVTKARSLGHLARLNRIRPGRYQVFVKKILVEVMD